MFLKKKTKLKYKFKKINIIKTLNLIFPFQFFYFSRICTILSKDSFMNILIIAFKIHLKKAWRIPSWIKISSNYKIIVLFNSKFKNE
jgi:hypothetical protein